MNRNLSYETIKEKRKGAIKAIIVWSIHAFIIFPFCCVVFLHLSEGRAPVWYRMFPLFFSGFLLYIKYVFELVKNGRDIKEYQGLENEYKSN